MPDSAPCIAPSLSREPRPAAEPRPGGCFHCGEPCPGDTWMKEERRFCCQGCLFVHELLAENGLSHYYNLSARPGVKVRPAGRQERWKYLDEPPVREQVLDFTDGKLCRVTFHIPSMHCVACVWLLENLFRLKPGVGKSQVNFPRREVSITFDGTIISLGELAGFLASIGYEPQLTLGEGPQPGNNLTRQKLWLQVGVAGFAFGNIMLFSLPLYLGLDSLSGPLFRALFGYISLALALPVVLYSAADYWRSAFISLKQRRLTLDVPIALGLGALYAQSAYEIIGGRGGGYLDSLAGLVFFLLCGRVFQQKTFDRMAFDRDYRSFFPLSVTRKAAAGEESVAISQLNVGDRLLIRNAEILPADARLLSGPALIDYSFVTGESEPVERKEGDYLYAGGQQMGGMIEVETLKPVSQSYLTSLWDHEAFRKSNDDTLNTLTNIYSRRFTRIVLAVAVAAAVGWAVAGDYERGLKAFASVLIVACPCALALAAPFALGTAQRLLAKLQIFLRNSHVLERLARVNTVVFDKTGTLTGGHAEAITFHSERGPLTAAEETLVYSLARHSTHPHAVRLAGLYENRLYPEGVASFLETSGRGIEGRVGGREVWLGSKAFLEGYHCDPPALDLPRGGRVLVAIDGKYRGAFVLAHALRPEAAELVRELGHEHQLALLSGDNDREHAAFQGLFGPRAELRFNQTPLDKLEYVRARQKHQAVVMMVGDGLNDAGALKQSDVGVAVVERIGAFSPASDMIVAAPRVAELRRVLDFSRETVRVVKLSFAISALYNAMGISIAAAGVLSPLICAVLMPLSSATVVAVACGATNRAARRAGLHDRKRF